MKHYDQVYLICDKDELKNVIEVIDSYGGEETKEVLLRMKRIVYPELYPDPLEEFHQGIQYYQGKAH